MGATENISRYFPPATTSLDIDLMRNCHPNDCRNQRINSPKTVWKPIRSRDIFAFLALVECSYITGATFDVNGGLML